MTEKDKGRGDVSRQTADRGRTVEIHSAHIPKLELPKTSDAKTPENKKPDDKKPGGLESS